MGKWQSSNQGGKADAGEEFWAPKAVPQAETYHCAILRAFPGEKGEVLIKKGGAKKDVELLTPEGADCTEQQRGVNRPDKWLSMAQGLR